MKPGKGLLLGSVRTGRAVAVARGDSGAGGGSEQARRIFGLVPAAIVVTAATALSYLYAFQYEKGYLGAFRVPTNIVSVNSQTILFTAVTLLGIGGAIVWLVTGIVGANRRELTLKGILMRIAGGFGIYALIEFYAYGGFRKQWVGLVVFGILFLILAPLPTVVFALFRKSEDGFGANVSRRLCP
jgi:hypothetical protein